MAKIDWTLLKRSLKEELPDDEKKELEAWLEGSEERVRYYERMKNFFSEGKTPCVDVDRNWRMFSSRTRHVVRLKFFRSVAACAAVVSLVAMAGLYWLSTAPEKVPVQEKVHIAEQYEDNHVVLYTGNGRKVVMDKEGCNNVIVADSLNVSGAGDRLDYADITDKDVFVEEMHRIEVPRGSEFAVVLSDGTSVQLNADTKMDYPVQFHGDVRQVSLTGEAYFEVARSDKPFIVSLNGCKVRVLGTHFNVRAYADEKDIRTTLVEGAVEVADGIGKVLLEPGEQAVSAPGRTLSKHKVDVNACISWKDGLFVFVDERLEDVLNSISRWYDVSVFYQRQAVKDVRINGVLEKDKDVSVLLKKIEKSGVARFSCNNDIIIIN